ncbi:hypothetical protein EVG20_g9128 [Dentipellis fragilis]|uniref:Uncharacterized protein n=1 Tax=Dentipellis fragilis TaxID=205917 RepID=A0A4Y9Y2H1_9AGAM|nr:hypothetical protein EVG20_g9128 [Dentipellis fragilis]
MYSFAKLTTLAVFAFSTLVSAVPVAESVAASQVRGVEKRAQTVEDILNSLNTQLQPFATQLNAFTADSATPDAVTPVVGNIQSTIQSTVDQLNALPAGSIQGGNFLGALTTVMGTALNPANNVANVAGDNKVVIIPVFSPLGVVLAALVSSVLGLVGGILGSLIFLLVSLLGDLTAIIINLHLTVLITLLGI